MRLAVVFANWSDFPIAGGETGLKADGTRLQTLTTASYKEDEMAN